MKWKLALCFGVFLYLWIDSSEARSPEAFAGANIPGLLSRGHPIMRRRPVGSRSFSQVKNVLRVGNSNMHLTHTQVTEQANFARSKGNHYDLWYFMWLRITNYTSPISNRRGRLLLQDAITRTSGYAYDDILALRLQANTNSKEHKRIAAFNYALMLEDELKCAGHDALDALMNYTCLVNSVDPNADGHIDIFYAMLKGDVYKYLSLAEDYECNVQNAIDYWQDSLDFAYSNSEINDAHEYVVYTALRRAQMYRDQQQVAEACSLIADALANAQLDFASLDSNDQTRSTNAQNAVNNLSADLGCA